VGSQIGAELSSMNVTEQIDAMEVSGTNPFKFLIVTRILATTFMIPILTFYVAGIGLFGGYLSIISKEQLSMLSFLNQVFNSITMIDIFAMSFRALVFGFTIGFVSTYVGFFSSKGTEGVGKAANSAVVASMFIVFIEELLIVQVLALIG
ncbi:ABC transporter permease, partial [Brucella sp. 21LCYQ03]|nr:ABC transporter permease [Brucella sp. 21LCYQ03]